MIVIIIYTVISFLLDGLVSNYLPSSITSISPLITIYSLISLIIIYNLLAEEKKYLKILFIIAILFDIVYTNTFILNIILFFIIYLFIKKINYYIPNNLFTINIKTILSIWLYHIFTYIIFILVNYNNYPIKILLTILYKSIIMTIIYTTISYILLGKIYDKKIK